MKKVLLTLFILISVTLSYPDEPGWEKVLDNTRVECIAADPSSSAIFIGTVNKGLYKSLDRGERWRRIDRGIHPMAWIYSIAVNPHDPRVIYTATEGGVYRSEDGGKSWVKTGMNTTAFTVVINPENPNIIYAGHCKSENGGKRWGAMKSLVEMGEYPYRMVIDPKHPELLYAVMISGRGFKSTDSGESWRRIVRDKVWYVTINPVHTSTLYLCGEKKVYKSEEMGERWELKNEGLPDGSVDYLLVDPIDPHVLYVGLRKIGIFQSKDEGGSWHPLGRGFSDESLISGLTINPSDPNHLYVSTHGGVWRLKLSPRKPFRSLSPLGKLFGIWGGIKMDKGLNPLKRG